MILRINLSVYDGNTYTPLPYSNLNTFNVKVNNNTPVIINESGIARIDIVSDIEFNNIIFIEAILNNSVYKQVFTVFGYDTQLDIILHNDTGYVANGIIAYRQPFTDNIFIYNGVADSLSTFNNVIANSTIINDSNNYTITQTNIRDTYVSSTTKLINPFKDRLEYTPFVSIQNNLLESNITTDITVGLQVPYQDLNKRLIDGVLQFSQPEDIISYTLFDSIGTQLDNKSITIPNSQFDNYNPTDINNVYTFTPTQVGDYKVNVKLENITVYNTTLNIINKNFFTYKNNIITNYALAANQGTIVIDVYGIEEGIGSNPDFTKLIVEDININSLQSYTIPFQQDGIYRLRVRRALVDNPSNDYDNIIEWQTETAIIIRYNDMTTCYSKLIRTLVCDDCTDCVQSINTDFNRIKSVIELFELHVNDFNIKYKALNPDYSFNMVHTILDNNDLVNLFTLQQIIDRAKEYCGTCEDKFINAAKCGCL